MRIHGRLVVAASVLLVAAPACTGTFRTSVQSDGSEAHGSSFTPALDQTGRNVAFASDASDLVPGDGNGASDVFVRDTVDQTTTLVSRSSGGAPGNGNSGNPSIGADGRYVLFTSLATNFVTGDDNDTSDVFLRDRQLGTTTLLSHATDGTPANGTSVGIELSDDGRKALIRSDASDLVAGSSGEQLYLVNLAAGTITRVSQPSLCPLHHDYLIAAASMTGDANRVAYGVRCAGVTNQNFETPTELDLIVRDRTAHTNTVAWSFAFQDVPFDTWYFGSVSYARGGSAVAWQAVRNIGVHGFFYENHIWSEPGPAQTITGLSDSTTELALSSDARYVVYTAPLPDYLSDFPHSKVSVLDRTNGQSYFVSVDQNGEADDDTPDGDSYEGAFSGDGSKVAFASIAGDIVPDDTNQTTDVFGRSLHDVVTGGPGGGGSAQRVSNG